MVKQIKGFVIVPPGENAWKLGYWTFAPTVGEAWYRKLGHEVADIERPRRIQAWHDKGYRLREDPASWRFSFNKNAFIKTSFRSKVVNKDITLVYVKLKITK